MITIASVPVKTRVPLTAWVIAGLLTLVSLASTLTHTASGFMVADQRAVVINHQASMTRRRLPARYSSRSRVGSLAVSSRRAWTFPLLASSRWRSTKSRSISRRTPRIPQIPSKASGWLPRWTTAKEPSAVLLSCVVRMSNPSQLGDMGSIRRLEEHRQ